MTKSANYVNIPTDVLRTVAVIADLGSFSKAANALGLTQPAITSQIKRLQAMMGRPVFEKHAGGVRLNDTGLMMLPLVRRMLETNDQILRIGATSQGPKPIRVGLPDVYCDRFIKTLDSTSLKRIHIWCDSTPGLEKGVSDGYLDVCVMLRPSNDNGRIVKRWSEQISWVRSRDFTLGPGQPIPLIGRPGLLSEQIATNLLESEGIAYRFAFTSDDCQSRTAAVGAGIGVYLLPKWAISEPLVEAKDYYLPAAPEVEAGIIVRNDVDVRSVGWVIDSLESSLSLQPRPAAHEVEFKAALLSA